MSKFERAEARRIIAMQYAIEALKYSATDRQGNKLELFKLARNIAVWLKTGC
jgi:hypothetical protein